MTDINSNSAYLIVQKTGIKLLKNYEKSIKIKIKIPKNEWIFFLKCLKRYNLSVIDIWHKKVENYQKLKKQKNLGKILQNA